MACALIHKDRKIVDFRRVGEDLELHRMAVPVLLRNQQFVCRREPETVSRSERPCGPGGPGAALSAAETVPAPAVANSSLSFCSSTLVVNSKSLAVTRTGTIAGRRKQAVLRGRIEMRLV